MLDDYSGLCRGMPTIFHCAKRVGCSLSWVSPEFPHCNPHSRIIHSHPLPQAQRTGRRASKRRSAVEKKVDSRRMTQERTRSERVHRSYIRTDTLTAADCAISEFLPLSFLGIAVLSSRLDAHPPPRTWWSRYLDVAATLEACHCIGMARQLGNQAGTFSN